ncbi:MAG: alpha/beta hydrolase [Granulosicoccus sp.]|nr:alpha/beta hydrolase [Granulosicoccus sp.]
MSGLILGLVRAAFRLLCVIAPRFAGNLAFRLFCRPVKASSVAPVQRAMSERSEKILNSAKLRTISIDAGFDNIQRTIQTYTFEPRSEITGTTWLLHGWSSRATHLLAFVEPLLAQNQRVITIDFPGHGRSSGRTFHLPLGVQTLHAVRDQLPAADSIIAHSLGGAVTTTAIAGGIKGYEPLLVKRLVLVSAPDSMPDIFQSFSDMIGLNATARSVLDHNVISLAGNPLETFVGSDQLNKTNIPTLLLHDPADKEMSIEEAYALAAAGDHVNLIEIDNVGHRKILYSTKAVQLATDFVNPSAWYTGESALN